jgi:cytochrome c551/c552
VQPNGGSRSTATGGSAAGGSTGGSAAQTSGGGSQGTATGGSGAGGAGGAAGTVGSTGGSGATSSSSGSASYSDIPCNVGAILQNNCAMCHGATPAYGAPMSIVHAADFAKKALDGTHTVGQAVITRINDDQHPMPQPPNARLTAADNSTLTTWIQAGAKAESCSSSSAATGGAPDALLTTDPSGPGITCYDITARDSSGNKFSVSTTPDLYHCFNYAPPWGSTKVHMISWRPLIDNKAVIHHWLLYNSQTAVVDKTDVDGGGAHPGAALTCGWAPGGRGFVLPDGIGQDVSGAGFVLETHYNNTTGGPSPDASGVRICVTTNLRDKEAGIHWLGTELIMLPAGGDATGTCTPSPTPTGPITILAATPHMHLQGRHMKTIINRKDGTKETLIDQPFDFNTQIGYDTPATIMPGDTLTTTCTYGGAAIYGEGTKNEMCYNFVLAYPNGLLSSPSILRKNGCTGL